LLIPLKSLAFTRGPTIS